MGRQEFKERAFLRERHRMIVTGLTAAAVKSRPATFDHDGKRQHAGLAITNRRLR
jgi:hypothetical protein